jgi:hypothetical protein
MALHMMGDLCSWAATAFSLLQQQLRAATPWPVDPATMSLSNSSGRSSKEVSSMEQYRVLFDAY